MVAHFMIRYSCHRKVTHNQISQNGALNRKPFSKQEVVCQK